VAVAVVTVVIALLMAAGAVAEDDVAESFVVNVMVAMVLSLAAGEAVRRYCQHRLGGLTGDVLGAINELTFLVFVFVIALR
jgi:adenosylcobinamide-GDP ribazoletransferase